MLSPKSAETASPILKKGPRGKRCPLSAFFFTIRNNAYPPAANNASAAETTTAFHPKNNPDAAISFISPPPNAPGTISVNITIGTLIHSAPESLDKISVSGAINIAAAASTAMAM